MLVLNQEVDTRTGGPRWVGPALLALVVLALLVIFGLPRMSAPETTTAAVSADASGSVVTAPASDSRAPSDKAPAGPDGSPWSDAQQAALRREAQDVLNQLLEAQQSLEARNVSLWAEVEFAAAKSAATEGDARYRERDYTNAITRYGDSLRQLQAIEQSIPERMTRLLGDAEAALEAGALDTLDQALDRAGLIAPENPRLANLRSRAETLPALLEALAQAQQAEADGDLKQALAAAQQASKLDPAHQRAAGEQQRLATLLNEQQFNRAMSEGYAALDAGRYGAARSSFQQARRLKSDSGEARSALGEVQVAETAYRLRNFQSQGRKQEAGEDWQGAIQSYEKALKLDPSVVFAQEGLARARPQAAINRALDDTLARPARLSDLSVARASENLLRQARAVQPAGPVLQGKIQQLEQLLASASQAINVTLRSDKQTQVTVYKVARLGRFAEQQISLRPGTYTAVGIRKGYRDVRQTFTVGPDMPPGAIVVICTEAI